MKDGQVLLLLFMLLTVYWFYVHFRFWKIFKEVAPDEYTKYKGIVFFSVGAKWIQFALERRYKEINNSRLNDAGDSLCTAHDIFAKVFSVGLVLGVFLFLLGIL